MKTKHPKNPFKSEISRKVLNILCYPLLPIKGGFVRSLTLLFFGFLLLFLFVVFLGGGNCSSSLVQNGYLTLNRE